MFSQLDLEKVRDLSIKAERKRCAKIVKNEIRCKCQGFCECYGRSTLLRILASIKAKA